MGINGSVNNLTGGIITGGTNGVEIAGAAGSVTNAGSITGYRRDGVYMGTNGSVNNLTGGSITGGANGVEIAGIGSVVNAGSIIGTNNDGVYIGALPLGGGGIVNNLTGGIIMGGTNGVCITNGIGSVVNAGSIIGTHNDGVYLGGGGSVNNLTGENILGNISGATGVGVYITNGIGSVINAGRINGGNTGVYMGNGGSVNNLTGGIIEGNAGPNSCGVYITGGAGSVVNSWIITGNYGDGVYMGDGGSVNNLTGGIIMFGGYGDYGVYITGGAGYVTNAGSIIGNTDSGVYMGDGGSVNNQSGGTIYGGVYGVEITNGVASVVNAGTIIGSGGTAISLGNYSNTVTLQTGSDVEGNIVGGITGTNAAILQGDGSYGNSFSNFETLTVQGDATGWNLTGTNTFSTNATVQTGLLQINGSLTTPVLTISNGAFLGGTGTVFSIVNSHGVIAPGNSIGTLNIVGSLNMTNAIYDEQVNAVGQSDLINVTTNASGLPGTAIISNATVVVQPAASGIYAVQTIYTNLTATGGVLGTNAGVSITPSVFPSWLGFAVSLQYPNTNTVETILTRNAFVSVANTHNQYSVAGALDGIGVVGLSGTMSNLVYQFSGLPSAAAAQAALDSMSGEIHGSLGMLDVQQQDAFNRSVSLRTGRISAGGESSGYASAKPLQLAGAGSTPLPVQSDADQLLDNIWLQGFGSFGHLDGDGNALGGSFTISGVNGGFDYRLSPELLVGLAVGYSHDDATVGGPGANGKVDAFQFGGYGGYVNGPWHLDGIFSYGYLKTDTKRFINVGPIHQEADGSYNGGVFSLSTEGGYVFKFDWLTVEPTVGLNYAHLSQDSFNETGTASDGNNYGLSVNSVDMDSLRSALGVRLAAQFGKKDGVQFIPALRAGWEHEFMDKTADVNARFVGGSGDFNVRGVELGADSGVLGAGLTVAFNKAIQGFVNYDANLNKRMSSQGVSGGLSYSW
jgi:outer membrane autotransporter protein